MASETRRLLALTAVALSLALLAAAPSPAAAAQPTLPLNDLNDLLDLTGYPTPTRAPVQDNPAPRVTPAPRARCGPGSRPLAGEQGRVPPSAIASGAAARGWTCNVNVLGHHGTPGGFRVWRYIDRQGHECAFYDTSLQSPLNVVSLAAAHGSGVEVLDMSDPRLPVHTATLDSLPMLAPHESLNLNRRRGLLAAELGNGTTLPGLMSIYSVRDDCRHPVLDSTFLASRFGHESGFARDGRTFWIAGGEGIAAVDVSDPVHPHTLWEGNVFAHGLSVSDDGNTLYDADPIDGNLVILDVSQVQQRRPSPVVREISRLTWNPVSVPQNALPMRIDGKRYLLEFDEFGFRFNTLSPPDTVGAARIISIDDPKRPRVVSNVRLKVNQPAAHKAADRDPTALPAPFFNYAAHYCAIPREVNPEIVACSFINSGLRVFNISDPRHPREVAYFVSPPKPARSGGAVARHAIWGCTIGSRRFGADQPAGAGSASDFAMSQPAFAPGRREVWYTDATSGFYALHLSKSAWPHPRGGR